MIIDLYANALKQCYDLISFNLSKYSYTSHYKYFLVARNMLLKKCKDADDIEKLITNVMFLSEVIREVAENEKNEI